MTSLFSPFTIRGVTLKNRIVLSPMCQYSARLGMANDWHFAHLARFALGGFGLVFVEATAVSAEGRITYGDLGLWSDEQIGPLKHIVDFLHSQGAAAGIQIGHAGRKASTPLWWRGSFNETEAEKPEIGFEEWQPLAPSPEIHSAAYQNYYKQPRAMTLADIAQLQAYFVQATHRAEAAGFDVVEIHAAHGYLLDQFLSPLSNHRQDDYGGSLENRMRLVLEIADGMRQVWPAQKPLFIRLSVTDAHPNGWTVDDSVMLCGRLKSLGVDLIDCSSGGFEGATINAAANYQVGLARAVRNAAGIATMTVGLITDPTDAAAFIANGDANLVALGRGALDDPQWPLHAREALAVAGDDTYSAWPKQAGFAVRNKDRALHIKSFKP
jgi:2,4-dienoyl-CoA reductase-like NADH-dependent reductase (Old Yellow Enzyme family)